MSCNCNENKGIMFNAYIKQPGKSDKLIGVLNVIPAQTNLGSSIFFLHVDYETKKFDMVPMNMCVYTNDQYVEPEHSSKDVGEPDCNPRENSSLIL